MQKISARAYLLQSEQIAALMMDAGQSVLDELLRNVCQPVAAALLHLLLGERRTLADAVDPVGGPIGDAAVQIAIRVAIESSARRIGRVLVYVRHFKSLAVVKRSVAAAMMHRHGVIL